MNKRKLEDKSLEKLTPKDSIFVVYSINMIVKY